MRQLLTHRDARLLLAGQTLSAFGDRAMMIVLAVWMKSLTGSSAAAGMTFFVFAAGALAAPLGGLVADRVRRRPLMIATDCALGLGVLLLLLVHDRGDAWLIYLVALLYGLGGTVFYPARAALLRVILPEDLLADANGALSSLSEGLRVVAPLAGAALYAAAGGGAVAVLDSATFAASVVFLAGMRVREERPRAGGHAFLHEVSIGARHLWATLPLRRLVLATTATFLVIGFAETLVFSVIAHLHRQPSFFGVLSTLQGAGAIIGGVTGAYVIRRLGDGRAAGAGTALLGVTALVLTVVRLPTVFTGMLLAGIGIAWVVVAFNTALQLRTPLAIQGRVSAAADLSLSLAQTISIATGAALSTVVDYRLLFVAMAAVMLPAGGYLLAQRERPQPALSVERLGA